MSFYVDEDVTREDTTLWGSLGQVLTHVLIGVFAVLFYRRREYYAMGLSVSTFFLSSMYHICKASWYCFGMAASAALILSGLERLRLIDHINSTHTAAAIFLVVAFSEGGGGAHVIAYRVLLFFVTVFAVFAFPYQAKSSVIVIAYVALVVALEYLLVRRGRLPRNRFALGYAIALVPVGIIGFLFYFEVLTFIPRELSHSLWHVFIFTALYLAVRAVNHFEPNELLPA
jgi:hypothetical protein